MIETDIGDELKDQGVVWLHRVTVKKGGEVIPTNTFFITFNSPELRTEIKVGYLGIKVDLFVSNTLRCFNCNRFGHTSSGCKTTAKCVRCGQERHEEECEGPQHCSNCSRPHASSAKE